MTRDEAESRRDELAREQPEVTWIAAESDGEWQVVKIGTPAALIAETKAENLTDAYIALTGVKRKMELTA